MHCGFFIIFSKLAFNFLFVLKLFFSYLQGFEGEAGSPVDMAKSYMKSLPPWRSPSLSGIGYRDPPPSATRRYKDRASYETADSLLHSSKVVSIGVHL